MTELTRPPAATARPWRVQTEGNRSIRAAAGQVTRDLFAVAPGESKALRDSFTDLTYILNEDGSKNIALVGNGPKQIPNAALIVTAVNAHDALVTALRALVGLAEAWDRGENYIGTTDPLDEARRLLRRLADAGGGGREAPFPATTPWENEP